MAHTFHGRLAIAIHTVEPLITHTSDRHNPLYPIAFPVHQLGSMYFEGKTIGPQYPMTHTSLQPKPIGFGYYIECNIVTFG